MASIEYRREVDGLRAIAVISVILYHAGYQLFRGGFIGVDIFFVISGYLITSIIISEIESDKFSISSFYERRVLRILPPLFLVVLISTVVAWIILLPAALKNYSQSLMAVSIFASNIFFWNTSGYFETNSTLKPLIHTWSLAVEEQYYLIFPLFFVCAWRLGKKRISYILLFITVVSLVAAHAGVLKNPVGTFFSFHTRVWELLIGALSALLISLRGERMNNQLLSLIGLLMIGFGILFLDYTTPFPSFWTLIPTIGTSLVILFCTTESPVGKLLGARPIVGVGLISYSAYLWHQPLFAFAKYINPSSPSNLFKIILILCTLILGILSWRYVETPFRKRGRFTRKQIFLSASLVGLLCFGVGLLGNMSNGSSSRLPPNVKWESLGDKLSQVGDICTPKPLVEFDGVNACYFGNVQSNNVAVLYGDSHAQAISMELNKNFLKNEIKGIKVSAQGCDVIPDVFDKRSSSKFEVERCRKSFSNLLTFIKALNAPVVVAIRWTMHLYPISQEIDQLGFDNREGGVEWIENREYLAIKNDGSLGGGAKEKQMAIHRLLESLGSVGKSAIFIKPIPEIGWDIARLNMVWHITHDTLLNQISINDDLYRERNRFILGVFEQSVWGKGIFFVEPEKIFCNTFISGRCVAQYNGVPFYLDDDHLSDAGGQLVVDEIMKALKQ